MPPEKSYSGRMSSVSLDLLGFLFVAMAFASRREASGYDPNVVSEVEVRNHHKAPAMGKPDKQPAGLRGGMRPVRHCNRQEVHEGRTGLVEADPVLPEVSSGFGGIPRELDCHRRYVGEGSCRRTGLTKSVPAAAWPPRAGREVAPNGGSLNTSCNRAPSQPVKPGRSTAAAAPNGGDCRSRSGGRADSYKPVLGGTRGDSSMREGTISGGPGERS